jgi:arylsulfatase A-like enzyme
MRNRIATLVLCLTFLVAGTASKVACSAERPNVLFIAIDDLNDWVGCLHAHPNAKTPNIDALARRGTLFTNAHCQAPICGPSRASLLSGKYPHSTGAYQQPGKSGLQKDSVNFKGHLLPEYFSQHGYGTYGGGKITHGYPMQDAFQEYGGGFGGSGPKPGDKTVRFNYSPDLTIPFTGTQTDWAAFPDVDSKMPDYKAASWAEGVLWQKHEKPFFLAVGFVRPHVPFYVPQKWFDLFPLDEVVLPEIAAEDFDDIPEMSQQLHELPRYPQLDWLQENDNEQLRKCVQAYLACTAFVDHQVGRVLTALEESSAADNTVIVLFSDHGYHLGEKHRVSKHSLWEESARVPMIIVRPGEDRSSQSKPSACAKPVGLIDLYPTLLELCDLPARDANEGSSLARLLDDPDADWRFSTITTYGRANHSIRSERYRFTRYEDGSEELYDHQDDPHGFTNLASSAEHQQIVWQHRAELPANDAHYHASTNTGPVNAWFEEAFVRNRVKQNSTELPSLFDGKTLDNWMTLDGKPVTKGWEVLDGAIHLNKEKARSGHIVTRDEYGDFDLSFEWKIAERGNSGLKYRVRQYGKKTLGLEYQILDDPKFQNGQPSGKGSTGSLYALYEPNEKKALKPAGEFNFTRIVVHGNYLAHWLNGELIASTVVGDEEWDKRVADSKFSSADGFTRNRFGRIMLTDHGAEVWYRSISISPIIITKVSPEEE